MVKCSFADNLNTVRNYDIGKIAAFLESCSFKFSITIRDFDGTQRGAENALLPIVVTVSGIVIFSSNTHFLKMELPRVFTSPGNLMLCSLEQYMNISEGSSRMLSWKVTVVKLGQEVNVPLSKVVLPRIVTLAREVISENALTPTVETLAGSVKVSRFVFSKAIFSMDFNPSGKETEVKLLQL